MSDRVTVQVQTLATGDRRVVVIVPLEQCISPSPFVGDPIAIADEVAVEVAMEALRSRLLGVS